MMLARRRRSAKARDTQCRTMVGEADDLERARRFRDAALPYLDEVYTLARYLLRDAADAEDAVQECYLRALKHFDTFRGGTIRPWLFAILRNVCKTAFARRGTGVEEPAEDALPVWCETPDTPEAQVLRSRDAQSIRDMVSALPDAFREVIVLREIHDLSYREIAGIVGVPIGTVMSRLARARSMLRTAWLAAEEGRNDLR
jgi:RNA polymerase sigma-70 factor (ECF subfamily)